MSAGSVSARGRRYWLFPLCALLWLQAAAGIAAPTETSGYHRSSWTQLDGAPPDIWALAQDRAATLWLGTGVGLYRFDGIQFEHFDPPQGQGFASSNITALHADARGRLWIGFYPGGISVLDDTLLQSFQGLLLRFQAVANRLPEADPVRTALEQALDRGEEAIDEGRERVLSLRLAEASVRDALPEAFARIGGELAQLYPAAFDVVVEGRLPPLDALVRDEVYWIGREALANAFRHADAGRIEVVISGSGGNLVLRFRDDGCGIGQDVQRQGARAGHWGLSGMRERAAGIGAELRIWSEPGNGTEVELMVPRGASARMRRSRRAFGGKAARDRP